VVFRDGLRGRRRGVWDVLGVLALRVAAALNRRVPRLEAYVHRDHLPHGAAFAFGGPIVPVARLPRPASLLDALVRGVRALETRVASGARTAVDRARTRSAARNAADELERARALAETRPLRVPIATEAPSRVPATVRLAALVFAGAFALSVLVVLLGLVAVRTLERFLH
jgi:hypothetical protein